MDDVIKTAENAGMTSEQSETAIGGVLTFLKNHLSVEHYQLLESKIPGVHDAVQKYTARTTGGQESTNKDVFGSLLGNVVSSLSGGGTTGEATGLMTFLASHGITPNMVQKFVTSVAPLIMKKTGIDIAKHLGPILGGTNENATSAPAGSSETPIALTAPASASASGPANADTTHAPSSDSVVSPTTASSTEVNNVASSLMGQAINMFGK